MNKIGLIIRREYNVSIRQKSFLIMTLLAPFLMMLFMGVVIYMGMANTTHKNIALVDESHLLYQDFKNDEKYSFYFFEVTQLASLEDSIISQDASYDMLIHIPKPQNELLQNYDSDIGVLVKQDLDIQSKSYITETLNKGIQRLRQERLGLSSELLNRSKANVQLSIKNILGETGDLSDIKIVVGAALCYIVFMFVMMYGVRVMRSVIEEKNSRIVEIIISSVQPYELMIGKIIGTALVALTQFIIWIMLFLICLVVLQLFITGSLQNITEETSTYQNFTLISQVTDSLFSLNYPFIILTFLLFFILGYLFYSSIFAAIGATVDNETETQQFTLVVIIPLMIGAYGGFSSLMTNPQGNVLAFLSIFPFTSPSAMVLRAPYEVPLWQWLTSVLLLLIATVCMIAIATKIYRIGILTYGNKASLKQIYKWLRY